MSKEIELSLAFLEYAPHAAAQVLQSLQNQETVAYLESVPDHLAAPVLNNMVPWNAARYLELIAAPRAASVLRHLPLGQATSLARLVGSEDRARIFAEMPDRLARQLGNALTYPQHQVGAWIDPEVPVLRTDDLVKDALRILCAAECASHVFLESGLDGAYAGAVPIREILRSDTTMKLDQLTVVAADPVANRASLSTVKFDEHWDDFLHLPVVGRRGNLLGGLSRTTLRKSSQGQFTDAAEHDFSIIQYIGSALIAACRGIFQLLFETAGTLRPESAGVPKK